MARILPFTALVLPLIAAQDIGPTAEVHPNLVTWKCTTQDGCQPQKTSVVLDFLSHSIHKTGGSTPCYNGQVNSTLCPDEATCTQNCVVEGTDYASHGVQTSGSALTLHQYLNGDTVSPRLYLLDNKSQNYTMLHLLNQEVSFDVDVSTLVCGMNGALYLSEMSASGGRSSFSPAGASFGSGYCDAQCPVQPWLNGAVNPDGLGACCNEMDLWEANALATQLTPHPCTKPSIYACSGTDCGSNGVCDKPGCGFNPYALGNQNFYGYAGTIDTSQPFTVVTQFISDDHTSSGTLTEIRRLYVQNGNIIQNAVAQASAGPLAGNSSITDKFCATVDSAGFAPRGGLKTMGDALARGMVLVFSIWNDNSQFMNWLDNGNAGPCNSTEGNPKIIQANDPGTHVTFSNIKWGDLGTTYPGRRDHD